MAHLQAAHRSLKPHEVKRLIPSKTSWQSLAVTGARYDPNVALEPELEQHRGEWVAHDEAARRVIAAADTAEALYEITDSADHPLVTVRRIPRLGEPIFIGLG